MQSSEKLQRVKSQGEVNGRIEDLIKIIKNLKDEIRKIQEAFDTQNRITQKRFRELYSYSRKLEQIYYNGLSNMDNAINLNSLNNNDLTEFDNINEELFSLEEPFKYDKPTF